MRGVIGTYRHMNDAHLGRYCCEFDLRYNMPAMTDMRRALAIAKGMIGRRLPYRGGGIIAA